MLQLLEGLAVEDPMAEDHKSFEILSHQSLRAAIHVDDLLIDQQELVPLCEHVDDSMI